MGEREAKYVGVGEVQVGDGIVGMPGSEVARVRFAGQAAYGGDVQGQRYAVELVDGRSITYAGDSRVHVLRGEG